MTRSVLITGASGFIGRDLVQRLAESGHRVRAAARDVAGLAELPAELAQLGDLAQAVNWAPLVSGIDVVVHLAGIAHATERIPEAAYTAVNTTATIELARACRAAGVARLVFVSSVRAQTGPAAREVLTEHRPALPTDAYGRSKLAAELALARELGDGATDWVVLRPVVLYGPGVKGNVRTLSRLAATGLPLPLAALDGRRSLLGLENLGGAVQHALQAPTVSRRVFLVADPGPVSVAEIVTALRRGLGRPPGLFAASGSLLGAVAALTGQTAKLERIAGSLMVDTSALEASGWRPCWTASEGLERWQASGRG